MHQPKIRNPSRREVRDIERARTARQTELDAARAASGAQAVGQPTPPATRRVRRAAAAMVRAQRRAPGPEMAALLGRVQLGLVSRRKYSAISQLRHLGGRKTPPERLAVPSEHQLLLAAMRCLDRVPLRPSTGRQAKSLRKLLGRIHCGEVLRAKFDAAIARFVDRGAT